MKTYKAKIGISSAYGQFYVTLRKADACRDMVSVIDQNGRKVEDPVIIDRVLRLFTYDRLQGYSMIHTTTRGQFVELDRKMIRKTPMWS